MELAGKARVEALRYRLQVRLGLVAEAARREADPASLEQAKKLRQALDGFVIGEAEITGGAAEEMLAQIEPGVAMLEAHFELGRERQLPKWLRYSMITGPVALAVLAAVWVIDRRRRLRRDDVDQAMLDRLEAQGDAPAGREPSRKRAAQARDDTAVKH